MTIINAGLTFRGTLSKRKNTDTILLHHREGNGDVQSIHAQHQNANGWAGIGYHYYVRCDGSVYRGRPEHTVGAHAGSKSGYNGRSIGICFEGNYMRDTMPAAQLAAGRTLIREIQKRYCGKLAIRAHRDVCATDCPGVRFPLSQFKKDMEDDELIKQMKMQIDGHEYVVDAIEKDGTNYIKLRALEQAGYDVTYDAAKGLPGLLAPDTRVVCAVPSAACDALRKRAGLAGETIEYLLRYQYGAELVRKLAEME